MSEEERMEICKITEKKFLSMYVEDSYEESIKVFHECYRNASALVENLENGEITDQMYLKAGIQKMIYAFRHAQRKKEEKCGGQVLNPDDIFVPDDEIEISIMVNRAIGNYAVTGNAEDYETGLWLQKAAIQSGT